MNTLEIEKTYLVKEIPPHILLGNPNHIIDLYIGKNIRLRSINEKYELTKKFEISGQLERKEFNLTITKEEFDLLIKAATHKLVKSRHFVEFEGITLEIDIWKGDFDGIITLEVEFKTKADAKLFTPPEWCFKDVTEDSHGSLYECLTVWKKYYN